MNDLDIMTDSSEIVHYDRADIPLYIRKGKLSQYPEMRALCHWHEDFEFIRIFEGSMYYFLDGGSILLKKDDCLFVNSHIMHYGYSDCGRECVFLCILIHPDLIAKGSVIHSGYITELKKMLPYIHLKHDDPESSEILCGLDRVYEIKENKKDAYELEVLGILTELIASAYRINMKKGDLADNADSRLAAYRMMVSFISLNYSEDISLDDIAESASVSKSTCMRMFRDFSGLSPFEFLIAYRLRTAYIMLQETDKAVTDISLACGFNHPSYFSKLFREKYGCQPKSCRSESNRSA